MSERVYTVTVAIPLTIDEEAITRTQRDGWREQMYDVDEAGAAAILALNLLDGAERVSSIDGWADMGEAVGFVGRPEVLQVERVLATDDELDEHRRRS